MNAEQIKGTISRYLGREYCFLVGRGTTAIHLALKAVERRTGLGEVILPTICCPSLAQTVIYAGFKPVFADVSANTFALDLVSFRDRITADTKAVLPVHIFGYAAPMAEIGDLARERGIFVIEDAAQSLGGNCDGKKMGSHGDFSILSFGGDKILNAGGGGALLTDDPELARMIETDIKCLPRYERSPQYSLKSLSHRNLYHAMVDLLRVNRETKAADIFSQAMPFYEDLYLQSFPEDSKILERIERGFQQLDADNAKRVERAAQYEKLLSGAAVTLPTSWRESRVLWRYSFLIKDAARTIQVTAALRKNKIHASNHYWSLADLFDGKNDYPNTSNICPRILNLWTDETATEPYISKSCDIILSALN
jgi:dTDP-4-amino-4,6-dideoxygalactose transaminase